MNSVNLIGRIVKDLELKMASNGKKYVNFSLAINENKHQVDFVNCVAFEKQAENAAMYLKKGSQVGVVGKISTNKYYDSSGKAVVSTTVIANVISYLGKVEKATNEKNYQHVNEGNANRLKEMTDEISSKKRIVELDDDIDDYLP